MATFFVLLTFTLLTAAVGASSIWVSHVGRDQPSCGISSPQITSACGTLYYASTRTNTSYNEIRVIGQNETELTKYISQNNQFHPCLPQPFTVSVPNITFTFDTAYIKSMNDWYPQICTDYDSNNSDYTHLNTHMFESQNVNLIINDLQITGYYQKHFGLIGVISTDTAALASSEGYTLTCNACHFQNIHNANNGINMVFSTSSITFQHSSFRNIESVNGFIAMEYHTLEMNEVNVTNSTFDESFIIIKETKTSHTMAISLTNCNFYNIRSNIAIVIDEQFSATVNISEVNFIDNYGSIYLSSYQYDTEVTLTNIFISTKQLLRENEEGFLNFGFADSVAINNMMVNYKYDLQQNCYFDKDFDGVTTADYYFNASWVNFFCYNPVSLVQNAGVMTMNGVDLRMDINETEMEAFKTDNNCTDYDYIIFSYEGFYSFGIIRNEAELTITNMNIYGLPMGFQTIYNNNVLKITGLSMQTQLNPNALQSIYFIKQRGIRSSLIVTDSHFMGTSAAIQIDNGLAEIYNSSFRDGGTALEIRSAQNIIISECSFVRRGRFWGTVIRASIKKSVYVPIIYVKSVVGSVMIENSYLSGYDDRRVVFVYPAGVDTVLLRGNYFTVNASNLYYPISVIPGGQLTLRNGAVYGLLAMDNNRKISIYENTFAQNKIDPSIPWIDFYKNSGPVCLSANNFSNYALNMYKTNVTSCFRESLVECVNTSCMNGEYGNMNHELFGEMSHFNIDSTSGISSFFDGGSDLYFAMDNIQINIENHKPWDLELPSSNILFLDSIMPANINVLHRNTSCDVADNDRLVNNHTHISKLRLLCSDGEGDWVNLDHSSNVTIVDHLSATQMQFTSVMPTYFPGQTLTFHYSIFDKLENEIHSDNYAFSNEENSEFIFNLVNIPLRLSQQIQIEQEGSCKQCDSGFTITGLGLEHNTSNQSIQVSIQNANLALMDNAIQLQITKCPVGYGPDSNDYHCHVCPSGTYNLVPNNTEECQSCGQDEHENHKAVKCYDGEVYVLQNYWLGFEDETNYDDMMTGICPSFYCCDQSECNFENKTEMCAQGRDANVPLCGACLPGYSQAMNSTKCLICDGRNYMYLVMPFALSLAVTVYLIKCHPHKDTVSKERAVKSGGNCLCKTNCHWFKSTLKNEYWMMLVKTLILKVLLYYEQTLTYILWPTSLSTYTPYIYSIASVFSLEIYTPDESGTDLLCFYDGFTTKGKILSGLASSVMTIILLFTMFAFIKCCTALHCSIQCESMNCLKSVTSAMSPKRNKHVYQCCNTNYGKAFLGLLIICVSQLLSVTFKLLNCQTVGSKTVHFYFGEEECLFWSSWTMRLSTGFLVFVVVTFLVLYCKLRINKDRRYDQNYALSTLCKYYTEDCYYWEFVILFRRICITLYSILYTVPMFPVVIIAILLFFMYFHYKHQPFITREANVFEYVSLSCTIIVISIQITSMHVDSVYQMSEWIMPFFILCPIFVLPLYLLLMLQIMNRNKSKSTYTLQASAAPTDVSSPHSNAELNAMQSQPIRSPTYTVPVTIDPDEDDSSTSDNERVVELEEVQPMPNDNAPYSVKLMLSDRDPHNKDLSIPSQMMASYSVGEEENATTPLNRVKSTHV